MMKRFALALSVIAVSANAGQQPSRYDFQTENCEASVTYDPARQDDEPVRNTADFLFGFFDVGRIPDGLEGDALLSACRIYTRRLRSTRFVNLTSVRALTATIADRTDADCALRALEQRAIKDPGSLRDFPNTEACYPAVDALEGKTDQVQYWQGMIVKLAATNGDPERFLAEQHAHETEPDFRGWVRQQILTFGWHNCANMSLQRYYDAERKYRAEAERKFSEKFHLMMKNCSSSAD